MHSHAKMTADTSNKREACRVTQQVSLYMLSDKLMGMQVEFLQQATDKASGNKNHFTSLAASPSMQLHKETTGGRKSKDT